MIAAEYARADVVVSTDDASEQGGFAVAAVDGVETVQPLTSWYGDLCNGGKGGYQRFAPRTRGPTALAARADRRCLADRR